MSNGLLRVFKTTGLALILGASMSACAFSGTVSWKEEVLLHSGHKIIVERTNKLGGYPTIDSRERETTYEVVSFTVAGSNKTITWEMGFQDSRPEPNSLNLLALDVVNGIPYIAAYPAGNIAYTKWGSPNPPYIFFKYVGTKWQLIPLEEFPAAISKTNVIVGRPPAELLKPFYSVAEVEKQNYDISAKEYKTIIRTPLDHWKPRPKYSGPQAPHPIAPPNTIDGKK